MTRLLPAVLLSATLLAACGGEPEDTRPGQPVAHRRAAFKELLKSFEPMGVMIRDNKYDPQRFAALAASVKTLREAPWQYFGPDTQYPPSHSKDEVWSRPETFEADRKAFFDATDKLAAVAGTKDEKVAAAAFQAAEKTCRNCHDTFKTR
jgi:cytochrome c556